MYVVQRHGCYITHIDNTVCSLKPCHVAGSMHSGQRHWRAHVRHTIPHGTLHPRLFPAVSVLFSEVTSLFYPDSSFVPSDGPINSKTEYNRWIDRPHASVLGCSKRR